VLRPFLFSLCIGWITNQFEVGWFWFLYQSYVISHMFTAVVAIGADSMGAISPRPKRCGPHVAPQEFVMPIF